MIIDYQMAEPCLRVEGEEGWIQAHWNSKGGMKASDSKLLRTVFKPSDRRVPTRGDDDANKLLSGTYRAPWKL